MKFTVSQLVEYYITVEAKNQEAALKEFRQTSFSDMRSNRIQNRALREEGGGKEE